MKTNLGVSFGLLGAAAYFFYIFGGFIPMAIVILYVMLKENNQWLQHCVLKAGVLACVISMIEMILGLIPSSLSLLHTALDTMDVSFSYSSISTWVRFFTDLLNVVEKALFLLLGTKALNCENHPMTKIDGILSQHYTGSNQE